MSSETSHQEIPCILVVDDEEDILALLNYNLKEYGFRTRLARDGREGLEAVRSGGVDLVVLDVMMPGMNGTDVCRTIRESPELSDLPIIMLTARSEEEDHVRGLDVGADIYLTKPVSIPVIMSQIRALLRRQDRELEAGEVQHEHVISIHDITVDRERYIVTRSEGGEVTTFNLPRKEFELLYFMASSPGRAFTRDELLDRVWGKDVYVVDRTVDVHVRKIREKLGSAYIETIKGIGYRFRG